MHGLEAIERLVGYLYLFARRCGRRVEGQRHSRLFAAFGPRSELRSPTHVAGHGRITVGADVVIGPYSRLTALPVGPTTGPLLVIGDGTRIQWFCHISAVRHVEIGRKVLIALGVLITDGRHAYMKIQQTIMDQPFAAGGPVIIGDGCHLGERCCILPGVRVGVHSVVGAHAVVTHDVPPYSVVVGAPARVIKRLNQQTGLWEHVPAEVGSTVG